MAFGSQDRGTAPARASAVLWEELTELLDQAAAERPGRPLEIVHVSGGAGSLALPLARRGHLVTVVDPSADALASLERRAREAGVADSVRAVQGDPGDLAAELEQNSADAVLLHGVLETAEDPDGTLDQVRRLLRPAGRLSVLVAQWPAAVLGRALSGHFRQAQKLLDDDGDRWGGGDPLLRRFNLHDVSELLDRHGFAVEGTSGIRVFSDLVPAGLADAGAEARASLDRLERSVAHLETFVRIASQVHLAAHLVE